jgi:hypothetical protein
MMAGYSGIPLIRKLGIKEDFRVVAINPPGNYRELLGPLPKGTVVMPVKTSGLDFIHLFVKQQ